MPIVPHRPRAGRLLDVLVIALCLFVFLGLGVYHYRRLDRAQLDPAKVKELSERKFDAAATGASRDWPHWRGPNYDGVANEIGVLTEWPSDGPKVLWTAQTGEGFASVAVADGRVFTIVQDGDHEAVICWDAEKGTELWRFRYPCAYKNDYGNGPRSTPSVDGDRVYSVGATGLLHCLKAKPEQKDGEVVWKKDLQEEFGAIVPKWGVSFSPLVLGDRLYIVPGGPNGNSLAALDKKTGAILWKKHGDLAAYTSPIPATIHEQLQILVLTGKRLLGVHSDTGDILWEFPWPIENECNIASPLVVQDYVFISSYYGRGCAVLKIEKAGDAWEPSLVYKNKRMRNHLSTSVRVKDHIYGFDDSLLTCMDFRTGAVTWKERGFDKGSLVAVGDQLIIYGANGELALVEANPQEYIQKSRFLFSKQARSCWSAPVLAGGRLYVRDWEKLVCFDVRTK